MSGLILQVQSDRRGQSCATLRLSLLEWLLPTAGYWTKQFLFTTKQVSITYSKSFISWANN